MNPKETANTSLRALLHIIFKRKILIITFFTIALFIVGIFAMATDAVYMASAEVLIKMGREHLFVPTTTESGLRAVSGYSSIEQINSEIELITSRPLIEKVIESMGPAVIYDELKEKELGIVGSLRQKMTDFLDRIRNLILFWKDDEQVSAGNSSGKKHSLSNHEAAYLKANKDIGVQGIKNSRIIEITFKHIDPQMSFMFLKKLVEAYLELRPLIHKNTESYAFFQEQSEVLKKKVYQIELELKSLKEQHDVVALEEERTLLLQQKSELQAELNSSLSEKVETENRIKQILSHVKSTPSKIQKGEQTNLNPLLINTLEERLVTLELKEKELLTKYTENNQLVLQVRDELKIVQQKLAEQEGKRYGSASFGPNPVYQSLRENLHQNQAELQAISGRIRSQRTHLDEYSTRLDKLNQVEFRLNELQNQLEVDQKNYHLYLTKYEENRISSEMDSKKLVNVSVIKPSQSPLMPQSPKPSLIIAVGFVIAIFGSVGLALFLEFLNDSLERPEDIESYLKAPVLASVAEYKI